jgi:hypothetical protein
MRRRDLLGMLATASAGFSRRRVAAQEIRRAAVVIGVGAAPGLPRLPAARQGASKVAEWLRAEGFTVQELVDDVKSVRLQKIFDAVKQFVDGGTVEQLVIYFGGHGVLVHYDEYWLLSEAPEDPNEAVSVTRTVDLARGCGIPSVVLISDACRSRADSLRAERVHGGPVFPNRVSASGIDPEVDRFFAARPGEPAHELPVDRSAGAYQAVFTEAFLRAYDPAEPGLVRCVENRPVVPNRVLKESGYLEREVARRLADHGLGYTQRPQAIVESSEIVYVARARSIPPDRPCPTPVGAEGSLEGTIQEILQDPRKLKLLEDPRVRPDFRALGDGVGLLLKAGAAARDAVERGLDPRFGPHTAVAVKGSVIEAFAAAPHLTAKPPELRRDGDLSILDIVPKERGFSVTLAFPESVVVVPVLAGYLTTVVVEDGRAVSVSSEPAFVDRKVGTDQLMARALDLRRRARALVDVAARFGAFVIDGSRREREERAGELLETVRFPAGLDPALGVQLAHAFAEAGLTDRVAELHDSLGKQLGVALFDTALLAGELATRPPGKRRGIVPFCPMLAKGWNWLTIRETRLPEVVEAQRDRLRPALWTTFERAAFEPLAGALARGEIV